MVTINKQIIEKIFDDESFYNEAYELLNLLIDLELEKEDDEVDFDFIDECSKVIVEINSFDEISKSRILSLIASKQLDPRIINVTKRNFSAGAKLLLIAAVILASTISVSAAVGNITGNSIAKSISSVVAEHNENTEGTDAKANATKKAKKKNTKKELKDQSEFVCESEIPASDAQQILVDCTNSLVNGRPITYSKEGNPYFEMLTDMPPRSANCDFDEEEYKSRNCQNTNDCINGENHEYSEWSVTEQPSCTELGMQERSCLKCGTVQECPVKATDEHDFSESLITEPHYYRNLPSEDGRAEYICTSCGARYEMAIPYPKYVVLDTNTFEYNGELRQPKVIAVLDRNMMEISSDDYIVEYDFEYDVNSLFVNFSSDYYSYDSQIFARFQVIPPRTQFNGIAARKGKIIPFWEKSSLINDENCTGYEIQYSTSQDFSGAQSFSLYGRDECKAEIDNLVSGETYYVRMRTVNEHSDMYNSPYSYWSDVRKITVK